MLFGLAPKERIEDLFDRKEEYGELSRLICFGRWVTGFSTEIMDIIG